MSSLPELKYFSYKNGQLSYREAGVGPTLFLLHGMNGGSQSWPHLFQSLAPTFRVVAWDAPGFGESDVFGDSVEDFKDVAVALMKSLKKKRNSCRWRATSVWRSTFSLATRRARACGNQDEGKHNARGEGPAGPYKRKHMHETPVCLLCKAQLSRTF